MQRTENVELTVLCLIHQNSKSQSKFKEVIICFAERK